MSDRARTYQHVVGDFTMQRCNVVIARTYGREGVWRTPPKAVVVVVVGVAFIDMCIVVDDDGVTTANPHVRTSTLRCTTTHTSPPTNQLE